MRFTLPGSQRARWLTTSRHAAIAAVLLACILGWTSAGVRPATAQSAAGDRPHYQLSADVDYDHAHLTVEQEVRLPNATGVALDRAVFQVVAVSEATFRLGEARVGGTAVAANLNGTILDVPFPQPVQPNSSVSISLAFTVDVPTGPGRLSAGGRSLALGGWFPLLAPHRGDWLLRQYVDVGDAYASDLADFDVTVTSGRGIQIAATGRRLSGDNGRGVFQAKGVRDFALALSPAFVRAQQRAGQATVQAYSFTAERAQVLAALAARYVTWNGEYLRQPYPYPTFTVADVDLPASYGGMEYPGMIFISTYVPVTSPSDGSQLDILMAHETAHQWFYSLVGNDQMTDPWLDEAYATLFQYEYYRANDPSTYRALWHGRFLATYDGLVSAAGNGPVSASVYDFSDDNPYFAIVYRKGARMLDAIRQAMGDDAFVAALADHVATFSDSLATPLAVLDLYQRHTSANLNPVLRQYVSYPAVQDAAPASWRVEWPSEPVSNSLSLFVGADFAVANVEVWLDARRLYEGPDNNLRLSVNRGPVASGASTALLLVRVTDTRSVVYERAQRVAVGS